MTMSLYQEETTRMHVLRAKAMEGHHEKTAIRKPRKKASGEPTSVDTSI